MKSVAITAVAYEQDASSRRLDDEARPQRLVAVEGTTRRPMLRWNSCDFHRRTQHDIGIPVIGFDTRRRVMPADNGVVAERHDEARTMRRQSAKRGHVHVVIV